MSSHYIWLASPELTYNKEMSFKQIFKKKDKLGLSLPLKIYFTNMQNKSNLK